MLEIATDYNTYVVIIMLITGTPVPVIYSALGVVHVMAARYYLRHPHDGALAFCAGLTAALYFFLAVVHSAMH